MKFNFGSKIHFLYFLVPSLKEEIESSHIPMIER